MKTRRLAPAVAAAAICSAMLLAAPPARAHVGSSAVVQDARAGPYRVLVTVRPPEVVPGVAAIDVRVLDGDAARVTVVPLPLRGEGASSPPIADEARASPADPRLFSSQLWLMQTRPWQVRVAVDGPSGPGTLAVPVPALARTIRPMSRALTWLLFGLLALLVAAAVAIAGAAAREAELEPGVRAGRRHVRRGRAAMLAASAVLALAVAGGGFWWSDEAAEYRRLVYKPLRLDTRLSADALTLTLSDPGWLRWRRVDDLVPDHDHLIHLFLVRSDLGAMAHLHPAATAPATFAQALPPLPPGAYRCFGDVVHASGLDETATADVLLAATPPEQGAATADRFDADDAFSVIQRAATAGEPSYPFAGGAGAMRWLSPGPLAAGQTVEIELEVEAPDGRPADGIEPYMGMAGHAMIVSRDLSVFAHVHPNGSVPMAALALVQGGAAGVADHAHHHGMLFAPRVAFPYVFPRAGDYRMFVQIKRAGRIETAAFDLQVAP